MTCCTGARPSRSASTSRWWSATIPTWRRSPRRTACRSSTCRPALTRLALTWLAVQRSEGRLLDLVSELGIDFVVLARYMRILSPELCAKMAGRIINIHHSFLPSFKGARPYHQAHAHGVKLIGATAHYVTADLDEGPIIEQEVARVDHSDSPEDLAAIGRDAERVALARAVRWHAEHRVLLHGRRTVIFR